MKMRYSEIRPNLQNNDKVYFRGRGYVSTAICIFESLGYMLNPANWGKGFFNGLSSSYSHTGSIVRVSWAYIAKLIASTGLLPLGVICARQEEGKSDIVLLLESTSINKGYNGVQLRLFSDVIDTHKGTIDVRHLTVDKDRSCYIERDHAFIGSVLGVKYEESVIELIRSAFKIKDQKADPSSLFCMELNAMRDQAWGILPKEPPANEYTPEDGREGGIVDIRLCGAKQGKTIRVSK